MMALLCMSPWRVAAAVLIATGILWAIAAHL
jgi:hypothetical protein